MKQMTKIVSMVFIIVLCCTLALHAHANTIAEQIVAPNKIQCNFYSTTQKTQFAIDASVVVPDVEKIPIYEVRAREFAKEEISKIGSVVFDGIPHDGSADSTVTQFARSASFPYDCTQYSGGYFSAEQADGIYGLLPLSKMEFTMRVTPNNIVRKAEIEYQAVNEDLLQEQAYTRYNPEDTPRKPGATGARNCRMTESEARLKADAIANAIAPDMRFAAIGILSRMDAVNLGVHDAPEAWCIYYTHAYELPYTFTSFMYFGAGGYEYAVESQEECLKIVLNDSGLQALQYVSPHEITGIISESVQLLSFDQIMMTAETLLPLKFAYLDANKGRYTVYITHILLGYMRVMRRDRPDQLMLVPVWDFFGYICNLSNGQIYQDWPGNSLLTINATDCTVIDRIYGY